MECFSEIIIMHDSNDQLRFLSQTAFIEESTIPYLFHITLNLISWGILVFLFWAYFSNVKEVVKATGEIIPMGQIQSIQHLEGGIVSEIFVKDGQLVKTNDPIIKITGDNIRTELERNRIKLFTLELKQERLNSIAANRPANFSIIAKQFPDLVAKQEDILATMRHSYFEDKDVIEKQLKQKIEQKLIFLQAKVTSEKNINISHENYLLEKKAVEMGVGTKTSYLQAKTTWVNHSGELGKIKVEINQADQGIREFEGRLKSYISNSRDKILQELDDVEIQIRELGKVIEGMELQSNRLIVRAPVNGIIKGLEINTIGQVLPPGKKFVEIVPVGSELEAEVKILTHEVGQLKEGSPVTLKVTAYDFSRYGTLEGVLHGISATTFSGERGERYYKARIKLSKNYLGNDPKWNLILPGMEVMADVVVGDKTIMQYLLKPIHVSMSGAFSER